MSNALYDAVARVARHESRRRSWVSLGVVVEVHSSVALGNDHAVSVQLRDDRVVIPRIPVAVGVLGMAATLAVGDLVVVAFADGDPHGGVVVGRLYHRDLSPPPHGDGQVVVQLPPGTQSPDIDFLADPATPEVKLVVGQTTVLVGGDTATVEIGSATLRIDGGGAGEVEVAAGDAKVIFDGGGNLSLEATAKLEIKAGEVSIEGSGKVAISGGLVEVN